MSKGGYNRPQRRRNLRRGIAAFLIISCVLMLLADRQQKSNLSSGRLVADDLSSKIMGVLAAPVRGIEAMFTSADDRRNAYQDNISLRVEVERLRNIETKMQDMQMRVRSFESMLAIDNSSDLPEIKVVARAVSESKGPFVHSALINVGQTKGVKPGDAVMNTDGLYGHIVRTGNVSSRVLLITDLSSRISVMSQRSQARAILLGNNTNTPKLAYVSLEADWQEGDRVITSGDGGVLPRGLLIGTVRKSKNNEFDVKPYFLRKPVDWVWVFPFQPITTPKEAISVETQTQNNQDVSPETPLTPDVNQAGEQ